MRVGLLLFVGVILVVLIATVGYFGMSIANNYVFPDTTTTTTTTTTQKPSDGKTSSPGKTDSGTKDSGSTHQPDLTDIIVDMQKSESQEKSDMQNSGNEVDALK